MAKYFARIRTSDSLCDGVQQASSIPPAPTGYEHVEITQNQYANMSGNLIHAQGIGVLKWKKTAPDTVEEQADTRNKGVISIVDTEIAKGEQIQVTITLKNHNNFTLTGFNGKRPIGVVRDGEPMKVYRIQFTNGVKAFNRTMNTSGTYRFVALPNTNGYLEGDLEFTVVEEF